MELKNGKIMIQGKGQSKETLITEIMKKKFKELPNEKAKTPTSTLFQNAFDSVIPLQAIYCKEKKSEIA